MSFLSLTTPNGIMVTLTVHLSEGSFVRKVWDRVGVMARARVRVRV